MNLAFIGSRIAPISSSELRLIPMKGNMMDAPSRGDKLKSQKILQLDVSEGCSSTPDSVTMYPAHPAFKSLEREESIRTKSIPTKSIPIVKNLKRTPSELQLMEDEAMADFRDYCMYTRIVSGITGARRHPADLKAINNIVRTRHLPVFDTSSSYAELNSRYSMLPASAVPSLESACRITDDFADDLLIADDIDIPSPEEEGVFVMDL
jgi:hypothetical protein